MKTDQPKPTLLRQGSKGQAGEWTALRIVKILDTPNTTVKRRELLHGVEKLADEINAALAAKDHEWNLARLTDIKELTDKHAQQLAAERKLLYRIGRRMMESQATGEPLNLDLLRREIDAVLYPSQKPERFA